MNAHFLNKLLLGFALIAAGVLFLLNQLGVVDFDIRSLFSTYWPVFIIYFGLSGFLHSTRHRHWGGGYVWNSIVTVVGTILLLNNLHVTDISFHDVFQYTLPLLLIVFGLSMLFKPARPDDEQRDELRRQRREARRQWKEMKRAYKSREYRDDAKEFYEKAKEVFHKHSGHEYIHTDWKSNVQERSSFIGDVHLGQDYWELTPLNISHFIGDTVVDLTKASIPLGETRITVSAFVGDVKLLVPNDYDVEVHVEASSFMGDMNVLDRREGGMMRSISMQTPHYSEAGKKIRLVVSMFIGDVVVKRVG
ncbi:cell wall-active antibiotics response protein LiaF [Paenibacillus hamazuiensis]|uniref:cell wall-active antibiotics response protein LiaF n=1 Tax=Paenibacillus hamazuiensis TaxID=2936508 RepID=UPI00200F140F|nr:cell wall-active antibiotics response protein LiaF [Paenibacillus hamazuiensis]